jgi:hypothetical protein
LAFNAELKLVMVVRIIVLGMCDVIIAPAAMLVVEN